MSKETNWKSNLVIYILVALLIVAIGGFAWAFMSYKKAQEKVNYLSNPDVQQEVAQKEIDDILFKVKKHIRLPEGDEKPAVATIQEVEKLSEQQPFFQNASNGDKLIVYKDKAIIYSVNEDILVNVGPVYVDEKATEGESATKSPSEEPTKPADVESVVTLEIRNGSNTVGLASTFSESVSKEKYSVIKVANAINKNYTGNLLVNNKNKDSSKLLADFAVTEQKVLPEGEPASDADFIIILGN